MRWTSGSLLSVVMRWVSGFLGVFFLIGGVTSGFSGLPFAIISVLFFYYSYQSYKKSLLQRTYVKYLNEKNDGIYRYYTKYGNDEYGIIVDTNNRTIDLKSGRKHKTITFDNVKSWDYSVAGVSKTEMIGGSRSMINNAVALSQVSGINHRAALKAWDDNGFFIHTDDLQMPSWQIKMIPDDVRIDFKSDKFWKGVVTECQIWMNVLSKELKK